MSLSFVQLYSFKKMNAVKKIIMVAARRGKHGYE